MALQRFAPPTGGAATLGAAAGMSWVRQHCDSTSVLVVARVAKEEGRYSVRLFARGVTPQPGTNSYPTRETAFEVGDTLVRVKFPHDCGRACSGWTEDTGVG